jgi:hypothetical protein
MTSIVNRRPAYKIARLSVAWLLFQSYIQITLVSLLGTLTVLSAFRYPGGRGGYRLAAGEASVPRERRPDSTRTTVIHTSQPTWLDRSPGTECPRGDSIKRTVDDSRRNPLICTSDYGHPARISPPISALVRRNRGPDSSQTASTASMRSS